MREIFEVVRYTTRNYRKSSLPFVPYIYIFTHRAGSSLKHISLTLFYAARQNGSWYTHLVLLRLGGIYLAHTHLFSTTSSLRRWSNWSRTGFGTRAPSRPTLAQPLRRLSIV